MEDARNGEYDIMGQMMLALRYGNAQKSSVDTGMRVEDTAQKLVQQGKFMGGKALWIRFDEDPRRNFPIVPE